MIKAQHIIGFKSIELGRVAYHPETIGEIAAAVSVRFEQIRQAGVIQARCHQVRVWDSPGRSFWEDDLVDDDQYVFLSVGPRYADHVEKKAVFGFVFDAEDLLRQGAILGVHDLAADYIEIIGVAAEEVATTLPRLPRISDKELDEFMEMAAGEDDPGMRRFISDNSTNPEHDLLDALSDGNTEYPGYAECVALIKKQVAELHQEKRLVGEAALEYLRQDQLDGRMEILVKDKLDLSQAVEIIQG